MKDYFRFVAIVLLIILTLGLFGFAGNLLGFFSFAFFAPKVEQVRYNTFKNGQAYNDGMMHDLEDVKMEYNNATPDQKVMLRAIALRRLSVYDTNRLPPDLQQFSLQLQGNAQ